MAGRKGGPIGIRKAHIKIFAEKNEEGKSVFAVELGKIGGRIANEKKNEEGKSILGIANAAKMLKEKDSQGRSVNAVLGAEACNLEKNEEGKSVNAVLRGLAATKEKGPDGKSINAVRNGGKSAKIIHFLKDELGRSVNAVKASVAANLVLKKLREDDPTFQIKTNNVIRAAYAADPSIIIRRVEAYKRTCALRQIAKQLVKD